MIYAIETCTLSDNDYIPCYKIIATFDSKKDAQKFADILAARYECLDVDVHVIELPHNPTINTLIDTVENLI